MFLKEKLFKVSTKPLNISDLVIGASANNRNYNPMQGA